MEGRPSAHNTNKPTVKPKTGHDLPNMILPSHLQDYLSEAQQSGFVLLKASLDIALAYLFFLLFTFSMVLKPSFFSSFLVFFRFHTLKHFLLFS